MRESFVKKSSNNFFKDKKAKVINNITNKIGEIYIWKGTTVNILGKSIRDNGFLEIKHNQIILNVSPEDLELVRESENDWPIEGDTLDLINHEFNFIK
jgi:hypothetical protein